MKSVIMLLFCLPVFVQAQTKTLEIEGVSPALYLNHTVKPKENLYSIGRLYNISPKEIAPFNNLSIEKGLNLNQVIKVPLTTLNFLQAGKANADEVLIPVYHAIKDKEGLFRVATNYNKLTVETLKKWNNITKDAVPNGTNLIVGYLKIKKENAGLAVTAKAKTIDNTAALPMPVEVKKKAEPVTTPTAVVVNNAPPQQNEQVTASAKNVPANKETTIITPTVAAVNGKNFNGGIFKADFDKQAKKETAVAENGVAATFKSNSGWGDGKYYCLHNAAAPGTIIKITSTATGKSVYAKVLDVIPDIKQNNGLLIRISNAAIGELGVGDAAFDCILAYAK